MPQGYVQFIRIPTRSRPPQSFLGEPPCDVHWTVFDRGGHFPAIEEPQLLVGDLEHFSGRFVQQYSISRRDDKLDRYNFHGGWPRQILTLTTTDS